MKKVEGVAPPKCKAEGCTNNGMSFGKKKWGNLCNSHRRSMRAAKKKLALVAATQV
jgi:hypothetical protein